ncbi:serine hydrolase [Ramlibacter tataouinensis]|uniref:serine hydrolase domain-containing protein n=1 Tax=Ramlibacter tataouinensis TaxID=94132 RepID=UPI0022F3D62F|nr:serine hydrolase [Ramlibacter tataouinensis]WBY02989.1 serine hydrolase [Ramlibacter tataouinensis]
MRGVPTAGYALVLAWFAGCTGLAHAQQTRINGHLAAPDERLLTEAYFPEGFHLAPPQAPKPLARREATAAEAAFIEKARITFDSTSLKAIALIEGGELVWLASKEPVTPQTRLSGYSLGKTLTSMTAGVALCEGRLARSTKVEELVPELKGTGYEGVNVEHLLTMSSGIRDGSYHAAGTPQARKKIMQIYAQKAQWRDMLPLVNQRTTGVFGKVVAPGETFEYKEIDVLVLGLMIQAAVQQPLSEYMAGTVLKEAGVASPVALRQDRSGTTYAPTVARMTMEDWVRFAIWVRQLEAGTGCMADYVKAATQTRISNHSPATARVHRGYGYLVWTDTPRHHDSYWAWGFGGQRIAWNHANTRTMVVFSSLENNTDEVLALYREWAGLR